MESDSLVIAKVESGSEAERVGLRPGDIVVEFAGTKIHPDQPEAHLKQLVAQSEGCPSVQLKVMRQGKPLEFQVKGGPLGMEVVAQSVWSARQQQPSAAGRPQGQKGLFDYFITYELISVLYVIGVIVITIVAIFVGKNYGVGGSLGLGLLLFVIGQLAWRVYCEMMVVVFSIHRSLRDILSELRALPK